MVRERSLERVRERGEMRGWKDVAEVTDEKNRRRKIYKCRKDKEKGTATTETIPK